MAIGLRVFYGKMEAVFKLGLTGILLTQAIEALGPYVGRGKGGRYRPKGRHLGWLRNATSKYRPHQGAQERARRIRSSLPSIPRRMWYGFHPALGAGDASSTRRGALKSVGPMIAKHGYERSSARATLN